MSQELSSPPSFFTHYNSFFMSNASTQRFSQIVLMTVIAVIIIGLEYMAEYYDIIPSPGLTKNELIADYYATESAVHVSPHGLRKEIMQGTSKSILVDLRSAEEYEISHIVGAINIPAYKTPDKSAYDEVDRIVDAFAKLPKDKEIVVYCYSIPCMTGRKVGKMLADKGMYVKHLGIGWNEWRYDWKSWNHELEWDKTKVEDYIFSGKEPGKYAGANNNPLAPCAVDGSTGC
jgi:rhodanese-related sulfurtransferase